MTNAENSFDATCQTRLQIIAVHVLPKFWHFLQRCCDVGHAKPDAPKPVQAPRDHEPNPPSVAVARGLPVWAGGLPQDMIVQRLFGHQPFQPRILLL